MYVLNQSVTKEAALNGGHLADVLAFFVKSNFPAQKLHSDGVLTPHGLALSEVMRRIEETDWFGLHPAFEPNATRAAAPVEGIEFLIRDLIWAPYVEQFVRGYWIAKGRPGNHESEQKLIPQSLFRSTVKFNIAQSEIRECAAGGARFVDVEVYSPAEPSDASTVSVAALFDDVLKNLILDKLLSNAHRADFPANKSDLLNLARNAVGPRIAPPSDPDIESALISLCPMYLRYCEMKWANTVDLGKIGLPTRSKLNFYRPRGKFVWHRIVDALLITISIQALPPVSHGDLIVMIQDIVSGGAQPSPATVTGPEGGMKKYPDFLAAIKAYHSSRSSN